MIYDLLAPVYDEINKEIDYTLWADFIEKILGREYKKGKCDLVLDLGCGTGKMTVELAKRGYDMTGVDISVEMLGVARDYAYDSGVGDKILWLCQDMTEFELYGTVDLTVSCLDCINHLISPKDLKKCFALVHNYLIPDGIFVFDVNGKGKFENVYADNSYVIEQDGSFCVWQNNYDRKTEICDFYITLFNECEDGRYERYDDEQCERMYTINNLKKMLTDTGFEFIGAYSDYTFTSADDSDERIYVAARCKKKGN